MKKLLHMTNLQCMLSCCDLRCFDATSISSHFTHFCVEQKLTQKWQLSCMDESRPVLRGSLCRRPIMETSLGPPWLLMRPCKAASYISGCSFKYLSTSGLLFYPHRGFSPISDFALCSSANQSDPPPGTDCLHLRAGLGLENLTF